MSSADPRPSDSAHPSVHPLADLVEPSLWPPGFAAWIKIGVVYQQSYRHLAAELRPLGLSVAQFDALANLYVGDDISQQELAARLLVSKGNVTGMVNRLADRGWVTRSTDPDDRRSNRLRLTTTGRRLAARALHVQREVVDRIMGALDPAEREVLRQHLTRLASRVQAMSG